VFQQRIATIPESRRNSWRYHRIVPDDTLASIARTYRVQLGDLAAANDMGENDKLEGIEAVVVPVPPAAAPSAHTVFYTTRRGATLVSVADRFGVSLSQLRRWNKLGATGIKVDAGRRLHVAEPTVSSRSSSRRRHGSSTTNSNRSREIASTSEPTHEGASSAKTSKGTHHSSKTAHTTKKSSSSSAHKSQPHKQTSHPTPSSQKQK